VSITYKLLFGDFYDFIFIHTSCMKCLWAAHTLEYRHSISTNATHITIMQRASKMQWVCIDVFKQFLNIIILYTFWVEIFCAVRCWAFCNLIFSLWSLIIIYLFSLLFAFSFLTLFVLSSII
jgi:hypothetical protein